MISASSIAAHTHSMTRSPHLSGVEVIRALHGGPVPKWCLIPLVQIHLVEEGAARIWCCGKRQVVEAGDVIVNAPNHNPRIEQRMTRTAATLQIYLQPVLFDLYSVTRGGPPSSRFMLHVFRRSNAAEEVTALANGIESHEEEPCLRARLDALVSAVSHGLREEEARLLTAGPREEIERARRILNDRFDQSLALDDLTAASGLSKFHFLRQFHELVGKTPHAYQLHLRIARARELLDQGTRVSEVALRCGFADQSHFSRCFKSIVGYTPRQFALLDSSANGNIRLG